MKKFSKKGVLLFAAAMALCAFAMPSMTSAASWGVVGSEHTLDSPNVGFTSTSGVVGRIISQCTSSSFTTTVASAQNLEITSGRFGGQCAATFPDAGATANCTVTAVGTRFPWTGTARTTTDIQIHGIHIDVTFENTPADTSCAAVGLNGAKLTITGTLTGGHWTGNSLHHIDFVDAEGLVIHSALGNNVPVTTRATFRDTAQTLIVTG